MSKLEQLDAFPITPIYRQDAPNAQIELGPTELKVSRAGSSSSVTAHGRLVFTPKDQLEIAVPNATGMPALQRYFESKNDNSKLTFSNSHKTFKSVIVGVEEDKDIFHPLEWPVEVVGRNVPTKRTLFHLINWPAFNGPDDFVLATGTPPNQGYKLCGRLILKVDGWSITIVEVDKIDPLTKELRLKGGYVITHVGVIERDDGSLYSVGEVDQLLTMLHGYFSFALGRWAGPQLPVGFDMSGDNTFARWGFNSQASGAWKGDASWFDLRHAECLKHVLPGFAELWKNNVWKQPLHDVIYWYVAASHTGDGVNVDSALLFIQAALELLAWTYCVQDREMVSESAFGPRGLSAADKLRILVSTLGIPLSIPAEMKALHGKRGEKWKDSMDAITDLRNGLVHPNKTHIFPDNAYYEAWRLSLWYIDMIVLRLCQHNGEYANRLNMRFQGAIEPVPWAK